MAFVICVRMDLHALLIDLMLCFGVFALVCSGHVCRSATEKEYELHILNLANISFIFEGDGSFLKSVSGFNESPSLLE